MAHAAPRVLRTAGLMTGLWLGASLMGPVAAQSFVEPPCAAGPALTFVDQLQSQWYRRFWTGDCKGLPFRCMSGRPYWNDIVKSLVGKVTPDKKAEVAQRVCVLGRRIGFEWSRPNKVRRIDTDDLKKLDALLEKAPDVLSGLAAVEDRIRGKAPP